MRALIIDELNMFFRAYIVDPSLSMNGTPVGGLRGSLNIIQKLVKQTQPDIIIICWDGENGSKKRKLINKEYKEGRKPPKLNRGISLLSEQQEKENKTWQLVRLVEYYNQMPVVQLMHSGVEADDLIAYIATSKRFEDWQKVIVSSDKDYYQLLDDKTIVLRPVQKEVLTWKNIVERYNIHPTNFAMARAMAGDSSDNLDGVGRVGLKTAGTRFGELFSSDKSCTFEDIKAHCKSKLIGKKKLKIYESVLENWDKLVENYQMMQLYVPSISADVRQKLDKTFDEFRPAFNKTGLLKLMMEDGFDISLSTLYAIFNRIVDNHKRNNESKLNG